MSLKQRHWLVFFKVYDKGQYVNSYPKYLHTAGYWHKCDRDAWERSEEQEHHTKHGYNPHLTILCYSISEDKHFEDR